MNFIFIIFSNIFTNSFFIGDVFAFQKGLMGRFAVAVFSRVRSFKVVFPKPLIDIGLKLI